MPGISILGKPWKNIKCWDVFIVIIFWIFYVNINYFSKNPLMVGKMKEMISNKTDGSIFGRSEGLGGGRSFWGRSIYWLLTMTWWHIISQLLKKNPAYFHHRGYKFIICGISGLVSSGDSNFKDFLKSSLIGYLIGTTYRINKL